MSNWDNFGEMWYQEHMHEGVNMYGFWKTTVSNLAQGEHSIEVGVGHGQVRNETRELGLGQFMRPLQWGAQEQEFNLSQSSQAGGLGFSSKLCFAWLTRNLNLGGARALQFYCLHICDLTLLLHLFLSLPGLWRHLSSWGLEQNTDKIGCEFWIDADGWILGGIQGVMLAAKHPIKRQLQ